MRQAVAVLAIMAIAGCGSAPKEKAPEESTGVIEVTDSTSAAPDTLPVITPPHPGKGGK